MVLFSRFIQQLHFPSSSPFCTTIVWEICWHTWKIPLLTVGWGHTLVSCIAFTYSPQFVCLLSGPPVSSGPVRGFVTDSTKHRLTSSCTISDFRIIVTWWLCFVLLFFFKKSSCPCHAQNIEKKLQINITPRCVCVCVEQGGIRNWLT